MGEEVEAKLKVDASELQQARKDILEIQRIFSGRRIREGQRESIRGGGARARAGARAFVARRERESQSLRGRLQQQAQAGAGRLAAGAGAVAFTDAILNAIISISKDQDFIENLVLNGAEALASATPIIGQINAISRLWNVSRPEMSNRPSMTSREP